MAFIPDPQTHLSDDDYSRIDPSTAQVTHENTGEPIDTVLSKDDDYVAITFIGELETELDVRIVFNGFGTEKQIDDLKRVLLSIASQL